MNDNLWSEQSAAWHDVIFFMVYLAGAGALLLLGCIIIAVFIVLATADYMQNGWTFVESLKRAMKDWP